MFRFVVRPDLSSQERYWRHEYLKRQQTQIQASNATLSSLAHVRPWLQYINLNESHTKKDLALEFKALRQAGKVSVTSLARAADDYIKYQEHNFEIKDARKNIKNTAEQHVSQIYDTPLLARLAAKKSRWLNRLFDNGKTKVIIDMESKRKEIQATTQNYGEGNYKGSRSTYSVSDIYLVVNAPLNIKRSDVQMIGGMVTQILDLKTGKAQWWTNGRGYNLNTHTGYLLGDFHAEVATRREALLLYKQHLAKLDKLMKRLVKRGELKWVTLEDSIKGGNCATGTAQFVRQAGLDKLGAIRSDYLVELARKYGVVNFVERAIAASTHQIKLGV